MLYGKIIYLVMRCSFLFLFMLLWPFISYAQMPPKPKIAIIFVIDQCSERILQKIRPYLRGGLQILLDGGVHYTQAHWPHSIPGTGPGHTGLATGTVPNNHGIVRNSWINEHGQKILCDCGDAQKDAVFGPNQLYAYGKSANQIMVDTLSDQLMLQTAAHNRVFSITGKSRSAICMAGKLGKAFWLDPAAQAITSSKAFFDELPLWIREFNENHKKNYTSFTWNLAYDAQSPAYALQDNDIYQFTREKSPIGKTRSHTDPNYDIAFSRSPQSHALVLAAAQTCLDKIIEQQSSQPALLWIGLSALDKVGHIYGADSIEYRDMLYHIDHQLDDFLKETYKKINPENVLFVLTSDHGTMPIIELLQRKRYDARRIDTKMLQKKLNEHLYGLHHIENLVDFVEIPDLYFNKSIFRQLSKSQQVSIIKTTKKFLLQIKGIKRVWAFDELTHLPASKNDFITYYKNQLFANRSGDLIVQIYPYVYASRHQYGTGHKSPYNYDTHVPLVFYHPASLKPKTVSKKVWGQQVAPTLALMLKIPEPSSCTYRPLPAINYQIYLRNPSK